MRDVKDNIIDIFQYGVTEMINNVLDHSSSPNLIVKHEQTYTAIKIEILDQGIGIFNKIQQDFKLTDARTALFELSKGKLTSDRKRHSGEGIYFTSRMFEEFSILSGHLFYRRLRRDGDDWLIEVKDRPEDKKGTFVTLQINTDANWTTREVFELYQGDDIYFRKTHVPISVGRYPGEQLVSRSQAKRILARFPDFSEVILDFTGVSDVGQAFADEIFRVFKNDHPQTILIAIGANENVQQMIDYVKNASSPASPPEVSQ
jgi:anti-sigma regulatory factor (Ser/Thr protein kinase)